MISIVIVTYNSEKYIYECLDSILNHVKASISYEIIIVDNNSRKKINVSNYTKIKLFENKKNYGFSKA